MGVGFIGWSRFPGYCLLIISPETSAHPRPLRPHAASDWQLCTPLGTLTGGCFLDQQKKPRTSRHVKSCSVAGLKGCGLLTESFLALPSRTMSPPKQEELHPPAPETPRRTSPAKQGNATTP